ncbi:hypothetical protein LO762_32015 [Actinocorallia sp. API 0066]|uniref:hypothetical protein n=1 Tax=Actinocorallia sp. API 0066 TaxID=2896846 RepID=UPI001E28FCEF|nr:hypothetical protein [Actinocorallia sp. API 0066]MCD0453776.1 hypothetical protein [Actinocorallia sp. API 0066]
MDEPDEPDGHFLEGLLRGAAGAGSGNYNHYDAWNVSLGGEDVSSERARLVTVHEALHATLNDCTAFGTGLAGYAVLALDGDAHREALVRLVGMCRGVHEAFATFMSIWLVSGDVGLLEGYRPYQGWYRDASDLVPIPDHHRSKEMMVEAAVRVCMQSPALRTLIDNGLSVGAVAEIPRLERPDVRFRLLHEATDAAFWNRAWERCEEAVGSTTAWEALIAAQDDPALRPSTYADEYQADWRTVAHILHEEVAGVLRGLGAHVLQYDGHRESTAALISAVEAAAPHARGRLVASSETASADDESFETWRRERLVVRSEPRPAKLHRLADLARDGHVVLLSEHGGEHHVFASARPAYRLLRQFSFEEDDHRLLRESGQGTVVAVHSAATAGGQVELILVPEPRHLRSITKAWRGRPAVLVNVALSSLADHPWRDRWSKDLVRTRLTGLLDLSPFAQFDAWHSNGDTVSYIRATINDGDGRPSAVFACEVGGSGLPLLLPCTDVMAQILGQYLEQNLPQAVEDAAVLQNDPETITLTLSHLLGEEHSFDVSAYHWEEREPE